MITTYLFNANEIKTDIDLKSWYEKPSDACELLWVDVRAFDEKEINSIAEIFKLHQVAVDSCMDPYRRPRLFEFEDNFYINLTQIKKNSGKNSHSIKPLELNLFVGTNFIITICKNPDNEAVDDAINKFKDTPKICSKGPMHAVYLLADDLVSAYFPLLEALDSSADKLEDLMLESPSKQLMQKLFMLKRKQFDIRKYLGPQRDVFSELARREFSFIESNQQIYFQDLFNKMIRIFDMLDTIREILSGTLDIYLSAVSNRLNEVMKVLTVISTIFMTLSFITGFYGMNLVSIPGLDSPHGFSYMLISMGVLTAIMLILFKKKKWL